MPDHFFDELDRDEIDLFGGAPGAGETIRERLREWLRMPPSPLQIAVAEVRVANLQRRAAAFGGRITSGPVLRGRSITFETQLRDARGRVRIVGAENVRRFLEEEAGF